MQKRRISSAYALELCLFCTYPLTPGTCCCQFWSCWCPGATPSIQRYPQGDHFYHTTCPSLPVTPCRFLHCPLCHYLSTGYTMLDPLIPSAENRADHHTIKTPRHYHPMYAYTSLFVNFIAVKYSMQNWFKYMHRIFFFTNFSIHLAVLPS